MTNGRRVALALILVSVALITACATASARAKTLSRDECQVVRLINGFRVEHGRAPLKVSSALSRAAERHSRDMMSRGYFAHSSLRGQTAGARVLLSGYRAIGARTLRVGEVIGWGGGRRGCPTAMVAMWMKSSTHRSILLSSWEHIGVGRVAGVFQGVSSAAVYTVDFGCRR